MKTILFAGLAALALAIPAYALLVAPPPGPAKMAQADTLLVGRVIGIEPQDVELQPFPGVQQKTKFRVAVVQVTERIRGLKDQKTVRVAFYPPPENKVDPNAPIVSSRPGRGNVTLTMGQDGLFILNKHHKENIYNPPLYYNFVARNAANFKQEVSEAKTAARVLDNPKEALTSTDAQERFKAAAVLINHYRYYPPAIGHKLEPIDAQQSKLILKNLLDGDWTPRPRRFDQLDPWALFNQLGLDQDKASGWKTPQNVRDIKQLYEAAQTWLRTNHEKYRIHRVVATGKPNNPGGVINPLPPSKVRPPIKIRPVDPPGGTLPVIPPSRVDPAPPAKPFD